MLKTRLVQRPIDCLNASWFNVTKDDLSYHVEGLIVIFKGPSEEIRLRRKKEERKQRRIVRKGKRKINVANRDFRDFLGRGREWWWAEGEGRMNDITLYLTLYAIFIYCGKKKFEFIKSTH